MEPTRNVTVRTALVITAELLLLVAIAPVIALMRGVPPVAYTTDLFTDPSWLVGVVVILVITGWVYRNSIRSTE